MATTVLKDQHFFMIYGGFKTLVDNLQSEEIEMNDF